jgi:hypothetical protein
VERASLHPHLGVGLLIVQRADQGGDRSTQRFGHDRYSQVAVELIDPGGLAGLGHAHHGAGGRLGAPGLSHELLFGLVVGEPALSCLLDQLLLPFLRKCANRLFFCRPT